LGAEQFAAIQTVRLHVVRGGFSTRAFPGSDGETRIEVVGPGLVRHVAGVETREPIEGIDLAAADVLYAWWGLGNDVLRGLVPASGETLSEIVLWPEHFDISVTVTLANGASANLGFSPGDDFSAEPYVYVGPWETKTGDFWNASFGAVRTYTEIQSGDAAAFLAEGLDHLR
jgi:hypothetical protein